MEFVLIKLIVIEAIFLGLQTLLYLGCENFQHNFHDVKLDIDDKIPFIPLSGITYSLWYPLIFLFPVILYFRNPELYGLYLIVMALEVILSTICYLVYPTTFKRPVPDDSFGGKLMKLIYKLSYKGINCAPSLHCSSCYLIIYIASLLVSDVFSIISIVVAVLIVISTMTTKQHTLIDAISAVVLFVICLFIGKMINPGIVLDLLKL